MIPPEPTAAPRPSTYEVHPTHSIERYDGMGGAGRIVMSDEQLVSAALRLRGRTYMASDTRSQDAAMVAIAYLDLLKECTPDLKIKPTIQLASGAYFDFLDPDSTPVAIDDIAHALSKVCRYTGHILGDETIYSVGQHSVLASYQAETREEAFHALMHDATESVLADISSPLKQLLPDYKRIEARVEVSFAQHHGFPAEMTPTVKTIDLRMLSTEKRDLMPGNLDETEWQGLPAPYDHLTIKPWSPKVAKLAFLARWAELTDEDAPFYSASECARLRAESQPTAAQVAEKLHAAGVGVAKLAYPADRGLPVQHRAFDECLSLAEVVRRTAAEHPAYASDGSPMGWVGNEWLSVGPPDRLRAQQLAQHDQSAFAGRA